MKEIWSIFRSGHEYLCLQNELSCGVMVGVSQQVCLTFSGYAYSPSANPFSLLYTEGSGVE